MVKSTLLKTCSGLQHNNDSIAEPFQYVVVLLQSIWARSILGPVYIQRQAEGIQTRSNWARIRSVTWIYPPCLWVGEVAWLTVEGKDGTDKKFADGITGWRASEVVKEILADLIKSSQVPVLSQLLQQRHCLFSFRRDFSLSQDLKTASTTPTVWYSCRKN